MFGNKNKIKVKKMRGVLPNGDKYEYYGEVVYNMMHGRGRQTLLNGPFTGGYIEGVWSSGLLKDGNFYDKNGNLLQANIEQNT